MAREIIKFCGYCEHCEFEDEVWYSEETGGNPATWECNKGHFSYAEMRAMVDGKLFKKAQNCPDFELSSIVEKEHAGD